MDWICGNLVFQSLITSLIRVLLDALCSLQGTLYVLVSFLVSHGKGQVKVFSAYHFSVVFIFYYLICRKLWNIFLMVYDWKLLTSL